MKILLVLVGILVAGAAGAAGAALFAPAPNATVASGVDPVRAAATTTGVPAEVDQRIVALSMEVADLQAQIRDLKSSAARTAVAPEEAPRAEIAAAPVAAVQRAQILQVIADAKAEEQRRQDEERAKRAEQMRLQRADRAAQKFGLNELQERQLADFYLASETKMEEMRESMRASRESGAFDGESMRTAFRDGRDWATGELQRLYGPDLGKQIAESEFDRFRGFEGGGGGNPRRGGGGGGGGNGAGANLGGLGYAGGGGNGGG